MVVKHAIPKALKTLSKSTDKRLRRAASNLILTLSEWEIIWRKEYAGTLSSDVRTQLCNILRQDIERLKMEHKRIKSALESKKSFLDSLLHGKGTKKEEKIKNKNPLLEISLESPPPLPGLASSSEQMHMQRPRVHAVSQ
mmetsp:Transcript_729/g.1095  ORF Transcript_729/g.1095 Transcript_729/m.1095 type:complete len:140 (+) Transcript_729:1282-1701(+)